MCYESQSCSGTGNVDDCGDCNGANAAKDNCGVCDGDDSSCSGCTNSAADNYDSSATIDDGTCVVVNG